jgi:hypothetical protein
MRHLECTRRSREQEIVMVLAGLKRQIDRLPPCSDDATMLAQAFLILKRELIVIREGSTHRDNLSP